MNIRIVHRLPGLTALAVACCLAVPLPVLAQKSLGGGQGSGPVMSRDELRACLQQQQALGTMVAAYDKDKAASDREKAELLRIQQAIEAERSGLRVDAAKINDVNARSADFSRRVADWNKRWQELEESGRTGTMADSDRKALIEEKRRFDEEREALQREQATVGAGMQDAVAMNARVDALNQRSAAWNERNKLLAQRGEDLLLERDLWTSECGNRRYREDDEKAIRSGK